MAFSGHEREPQLQGSKGGGGGTAVITKARSRKWSGGERGGPGRATLFELMRRIGADVTRRYLAIRRFVYCRDRVGFLALQINRASSIAIKTNIARFSRASAKWEIACW